MREIIKLSCTGCEAPGKSAYFMTKNKKAKSEKLVTKKFCKFCRKHNDHKESKV
jgi:large subunit ribosomal protein L33